MIDMDNKELEFLKNRTIVQNNALTMARYRWTAGEQDLVYMLLLQLYKSDPVDKVYYILIKDLEAMIGKTLNYKQVKENTLKLISRVYTITEGEDILQVGMISSARYLKGEGKIAIRIDPEVRPYLFDLKTNYTKYGAFMAMTLQSMYSKRLYEILSQFKHTGIMRISIYKLKYILDLIDEKSSKETYPIWTTFAKKVLEVARKELDQYTDISFTYTVKKQGRKFTDLEFKIISKNPQLSLDLKDLNTDFYKRLTDKFKLSAWQATLLLEHIPEREIHSTLYEIQLRNISGEIKNIGGFTAHTFENKYKLGLLGQDLSDKPI